MMTEISANHSAPAPTPTSGNAAGQAADGVVLPGGAGQLFAVLFDTIPGGEAAPPAPPFAMPQPNETAPDEESAENTDETFAEDAEKQQDSVTSAPTPAVAPPDPAEELVAPVTPLPSGAAQPPAAEAEPAARHHTPALPGLLPPAPLQDTGVREPSASPHPGTPAQAEAPPPPSTSSATQVIPVADDLRIAPERRSQRREAPPREQVTPAPTAERAQTFPEARLAATLESKTGPVWNAPTIAVPAPGDVPQEALLKDLDPEQEPGVIAGTGLSPAGSSVTNGAALLRPTVATEFGARAMTDQLAAIATRNADGTTEIRLSPAELGSLRMTLSHTDSGLQVMIVAERPETGDLIRRNADQLLGAFRDAGFANANLTFGSEREHESQRDRGSHAPPRGADVDGQASQSNSIQIAYGGTATESLDLRL